MQWLSVDRSGATNITRTECNTMRARTCSLASLYVSENCSNNSRHSMAMWCAIQLRAVGGARCEVGGRATFGRRADRCLSRQMQGRERSTLFARTADRRSRGAKCTVVRVGSAVVRIPRLTNLYHAHGIPLGQCINDGCHCRHQRLKQDEEDDEARPRLRKARAHDLGTTHPSGSLRFTQFPAAKVLSERRHSVMLPVPMHRMTERTPKHWLARCAPVCAAIQDFETFARGLAPAPVIRFPRGSRQWRQQYRLQLHLPRAKAQAA